MENFEILPEDILPAHEPYSPSEYNDGTYLPEDEDAVWDGDEGEDEDDYEEFHIPSSFEIMSKLVTKQLEKSTILYEHQVEALKRLKEHVDDFNSANGLPDIHMISLPTGTGKNTIIALAPYVLGAKNVLIITPSALISRQIATDLGHTKENLLLKHNIIRRNDLTRYMKQGSIPNPVLIENVKDTLAFKLFPLVIANAQMFSSPSSIDFKNFPYDFDMVIIDEAHHYPAESWKKLVSRFVYSKTIIMTATPEGREGKDIIDNQSKLSCYEMNRTEAIDKGIIRKITKSPCGSQSETQYEEHCKVIGTHIMKILNEHDQQDSTVNHQAIIITEKSEDSSLCVKIINELLGNNLAIDIHSSSIKDNLAKFEKGTMKIMVSDGLLEGCDKKEVSVVGILRNINTSSHVLFSQLVGRCVRKCHNNDPVDATIVWHNHYHQLEDNYNNFIGINGDELLTEIEPQD